MYYEDPWATAWALNPNETYTLYSVLIIFHSSLNPQFARTIEKSSKLLTCWNDKLQQWNKAGPFLLVKNQKTNLPQCTSRERKWRETPGCLVIADNVGARPF